TVKGLLQGTVQCEIGKDNTLRVLNTEYQMSNLRLIGDTQEFSCDSMGLKAHFPNEKTFSLKKLPFLTLIKELVITYQVENGYFKFFNTKTKSAWELSDIAGKVT